ncbi:Uncharacterised protein [Mycobacteroides abscessus subsp. abscessus]|nr:Uncharacterised protein [Mycobacteroides abscessus subsp. abscessus]
MDEAKYDLITIRNLRYRKLRSSRLEMGELVRTKRLRRERR